jgi:acyl transferase domain-containing protein/acyl carrier protein
MDSLKMIEFHHRLTRGMGLDFPVSVLFGYSSVLDLAEFIAGENRKETESDQATSIREAKESIAITGMACRFPGGADSPEMFWDILIHNRDVITEIPEERWNTELYYDPDPSASGKMYTRRGGFIKDVDRFDAPFFNISPGEAESLDPQQRILLEICWEALEKAGLDINRLRAGRTGVFIGISNIDYSSKHIRSGDLEKIDQYSLTGAALSTAVGRISYAFGLQGPNMAIDTACSSSLVAVHTGVQSLRNRESDLVLAGGVNLLLSPEAYVGLCKTNALSPDGICRAFDADANGYVRGEGCGVIVMKRLSDAQRDGDNILAIIKGCAVNHDGRSGGLTVPNGRSQQGVIKDALKDGGIRPEDVSYIETHGTGTQLGDPIEVLSLASIFEKKFEKKLLIGSVKTNIGHLESAAGIAGLIKVILSLQNKTIPGHLHYHHPNPHIPWDNFAIKVADKNTAWANGRGPLLAGISSFGFSGTNGHILLQEVGKSFAEKEVPPRDIFILPISAKSKKALRFQAKRYHENIEKNIPKENLYDICYSASVRRSHLENRFVSVFETKSELFDQLRKFYENREALLPGSYSGHNDTGRIKKLAFVFSDSDLFDLQLSICNTLESYGIYCDGVIGCGSGETAAAQFIGNLSIPGQSEHIKHSGQFSEAVHKMIRNGYNYFIEIGPHPVLLDQIREYIDHYKDQACKVIPTLKQNEPREKSILNTLAALYVGGFDIRWDGIYSKQGNVIELPTYPWQKKRYWIDNKEIKDRFYKLEWQPTPAIANTNNSDSGTWLIFADNKGLGNRVSELLKRQGKITRCVYSGELLDSGGSFNFNEFLHSEPISEIIYLWPLDTDPTHKLSLSALEQTQALCGMEFINLVRATLEQKNKSRLWIVTRMAIAVTDESNSELSVGQSLICGMGKVVALDHPEIWGGMIDLSYKKSSNEAQLLITEIQNSTFEDHVAFRNNQRYVARLKRAETNLQKVNIRQNRTYLITGGTGMLGLSVAKWLAEKGATHLLLTSRNRPSGEAEEKIQTLRNGGIIVVEKKTDVSDEREMIKVFESMKKDLPLPAGVFHLAGITDFSEITNLKAKDIETILKPKVMGTWILHCLTKDMELDFFVSFSSIVSVLGSRRQALYAGANHFLDTLTHYRKSLGLPGMSLNWGPWSGGGITSDEIQALLHTIGIESFRQEEGLHILDHVLTSAEPQLVVAQVDWSIFKTAYQVKRDHPILKKIHSGITGEDQKKEPFILELETKDINTRQELFMAYLKKQVAIVFGFESSDTISPQGGFFELGMDSFTAIELQSHLEKDLGLKIPSTILFDYPNIESLSGYFCQRLGWLGPESADIAEKSKQFEESIAIIGMACRFPGKSNNPEEFWKMLCNGVDAVSEVPAERWDINTYFDPDPTAPGKTYCKYGGFLEDIDGFDPIFFGISPKEAKTMDPQQRVLLEVCYETLENSGIVPEKIRYSKTGVFIGVSNNEYAHMLTASGDTTHINADFATGNSLSAISGRISYTLGLQGPCLAIDTACSSSLVAVHMACQSLRMGESNQAIAGGVNLLITPTPTIATSQLQMLSPEGRCKTFDAQANGYVRGEGCGVVMLKRLSDAEADEDNILAIIRGSAVNQDGPSSGFTVPNGLAQETLIRQALAYTNISPNELGYIEAHGSGTSMGDSIEIKALSTIYCKGRNTDQPLVVGSVKTNLGHLESAAGIAGLIKTILILRNGEIPPHLHFRNPNPGIPWNELPIRVSTERLTWPTDHRPRMAAVSSFGFSGTNAHILIEQSENRKKQSTLVRQTYFFPLSGKNKQALKELSKKYIKLIQNKKLSLYDLCYSSALRRSHHEERLVCIFESRSEVLKQLSAFEKGLLCNGLFRGPVSANTLYQEMAALYLKGEEPDWQKLFPSKGNFVDLPNYPWQKERYWIDTTKNPALGNKIKKNKEIKDWFYTLEWQSMPHIQGKNRPNPGTWLILADQGGLGEAIAKTLRKQGDSCILIYATDDFKPNELFAETREVSQVIYLWALDTIPTENLSISSLEKAQDLCCIYLINLVKAILEQKVLPQLWLVTRMAISLSQSLVCGLGKTIALEHPRLWGGMIDLSPEKSHDEPQRLIAEVTHSENEDHISFRNGKRYVLRLKKGISGFSKRVTIKNNQTYLITGGTGSLGLKTAQWLVQKGATHLILISRKGELGQARETIQGLRDNNVTIDEKRVDVSSEKEMTVLFEEIQKHTPQLAGIFHLAGLTDYREISDIESKDAEAVIRPKVIGAWILHQLTKDMHLDLFVSFSSIASVWGSKGQAHYAAANHFLDSLSHHRKALGLPSVTLNWGPWSGGGMTSDVVQSRLDKIGIRPINPKEAIHALEYVTGTEESQVVVARIDWSIFKGVYQIRRNYPLLNNIATKEKICSKIKGKTQFVYEMEKEDVKTRHALLVDYLKEEVSKILGFKLSEMVHPEKGFFQMGMNSLTAIELKSNIANTLGLSLPSTVFFEHPNINALADHFYQKLSWGIQKKSEEKTKRPTVSDELVAIIGMACRFPGKANDPKTFWQILCNGTNTVTEIPSQRWNINECYDPNPSTPGKMYCRYGAFLQDEEIENFDSLFFGISPREAQTMDPQQRILLEVSYEALENGGLVPEKIKHSQTGVFIGVTNNEYAQLLMSSGDKSCINDSFVTGNSLNAIPGRISYTFGLQGPSMAIDTACSSSLVAVHLACQSIRLGESDQALAGGVNMLLAPESTIATSQSRMLSPDGKCKTFDTNADGYVRGEGCGVIVLKRLSDAEADGDNILAIIKGSAVNQDGPSSGFTVPNGSAQEALIRQALTSSDLTPGDIGYVETHGTGTPLGDPIEVRALGSVYCESRDAHHPLVISTVKTNIGHLESAAGIAGLIKSVLILQHGEIPPHLHFKNPNPEIPWDALPLKVPTEQMNWPTGSNPRRAAVSAFGFSGTNAHVLLEQAGKQGRVDSNEQRSTQTFFLPISAKNKQALQELAEKYYLFIKKNRENLYDICYAACLRRGHYEEKLVCVFGSESEILEQLKAYNQELTHKGLFTDSFALQKETFINMYEEMASLYLKGEEPDWSRIFPKPGVPIILPTYTWQKERYWMAPPNDQGSIIPPFDDWYYKIQWQKKSQNYSKSYHVTEPLLIFCDQKGVGEQVVDILKSHSQNSIRVYLGDKYKKLGDQSWCLDPLDQTGFEKLFHEIPIKIKKIIHLWALDTPAANELTLGSLTEAQSVGCGSVLHLVQTMAGQKWLVPAKLWLVTQGTQSVADSALPVNPTQSPLWGLGRVISIEHPEIWGGLLDLPHKRNKKEDALRILREIQNPEEDQIAFRNAQRYVPRLVRDRISRIINEEPLLKKEATYLITGGTRGLGLRIAQWMVDEGCRHLVIFGRQAPSEETVEIIRNLKEKGAEISVSRTDVANREGVVEAVKVMNKKMPPLKGIIHAAGLLDEGVLLQQSWERFRSVMAPKVQGTWNLHAITQDMNLDFFICFSSVASVLGAIGQGNYAAANSFQDSIAHYRQNLGLSGLSLNWGPWSEIGMTTRMTDLDIERWTSQGMSFIKPEQGLKILEEKCQTDTGQKIILSINWTDAVAANQARRIPVLEEIIKETGGKLKKQPNIPTKLKQLPSSEQYDFLLSYIKSQVGRILRINSPEQIQTGKRLFDLGINSLMSIELKNSLEVNLGHPLSSTLVYNYPTIEAIVDHLTTDILHIDTFSQPNQEKSESDSISDSFREEIEKITDEEVEEMLLKELDDF